MIKLFFLTLLISTTIIPASSILDSANNAYANNDLPNAIVLYKKAIREGDNPALSAFNLGNAYYQIDSLYLSILYYTDCVLRAPDFARGHFNRSAVFFAMNDFGSCIASAHRAAALDPNNSRIHILLGNAYRKLQKNSLAVTSFEEAHRLMPTLEEPPIALAEIYAEYEDYPSAQKWLNRCPEQGKNRGYITLLQAENYKKAGDTARALQKVRLACELEPNNEWAFYEKIILTQSTGLERLALEDCRSGLSLFPEFDELALVGGNIAYKLTAYDEAEYFYNKAIELGNAEGVVGKENIRIIRKNIINSSKSTTNN